jgi:two-component system sensor histidine kinase DesK
MTQGGNGGGRAAGTAADDSVRPFGGFSLLNDSHPNAARIVAGCVWLLFIVFPLVNAIGKHEPALDHALVIAGAAVFVAAYVALVLHWRGRSRNPVRLLLFGLMLAVSSALTIGQASGWGFMFTYCAAVAAMVAPAGTGFYLVSLCAVLAGVCSPLGGADGGTTLGFVASAAGIGLLMLVMRDLRIRNIELSEARAELAGLAVAEERERFARDLHDLLGHSLSVIALKAELAGRMLAAGPRDAANEVAELEQVARTALGEVREAVSGYRQPTLDGELAGARMALSAAGIHADVQQARVSLDPAVEAVLAWAVREGATNVIRHSGARHCTLRVTASLTDATVEVIDDGSGDREMPTTASVPTRAIVATSAGAASGAGIPSPTGLPNGAGGLGGFRPIGSGGGHGLAGLAERAALLNGRIEAGPFAGGGYRLAVIVPVSHT